MTFTVGVLGPVQLAGRDASGAAMRALLAALALTGTASVRSSAALADDVWGEQQPQNPRSALQSLVSRARAAGGADLVRSTPSGYGLGTEETDLQRARALLLDATSPGCDEVTRISLLESAIALWRGEPGLDLGDAPVATELERTASALRDTIVSALAAAHTAVGRDADAVVRLTALAGSHPLDEGIHLALMESLARVGRTAEALALFADLRARLRDELGSSPSPAAVELNARLLRSADEVAVRTRIGVQAAPNELVGRDEELREAKALLRRARLLTILGTGGLGKTRFAQAIALDSEAPAVVVVTLAGVRTDAGVLLTIADTLGISEGTAARRLTDAASRPDLLTRVVAALDRPTLLVMDNCEQVVDGAAATAADLLAALPSLRIVATSRTPLAIAAERVFPLAPLTIAVDPGAPAIRLFQERAHAARPGASLDLDVVARLCRHLDGLPLAIELAAARVRTMTPEQIEARLKDRFALLTSGDRSAPERHRTLQAVIEWSWDLLEPEAQRALAVLSVLPGGFSASAAEELLTDGDADDVIDSLVSHSLLIALETPSRGEVRFRMLETVREFGHQQLERIDGTRASWRAVVDWALRFVTSHGAHARVFPAGLTPAQHRVVTEEHDNLVHVMGHLMSTGRDQEVIRIFAVLGQSWYIRGAFTEFVGYAPILLELAMAAPDRGPDEDLAVIALVLAALGCMIRDGTVRTRALAVLRRRITAAGARLAPAWRLLSQALVAAGSGGSRGTAPIEAGDSDDRALLVADLLGSFAAENDAEPVRAMDAARRAWERARRIDEPWAEGSAADLAAQLTAQSGRAAEALTWLDRAGAVFEEYGAEDHLRQQAWVRAGALLWLGRTAQAAELFQGLIDDGGLSQDGLEMGTIGAYGLAEVLLVDGDLPAAKEAFARVMESFDGPVRRRSPWYLMALAGYVSVGARLLDVPDEELSRWERRLRTRAIAAARVRRDDIDRPVLGTALLGWSAWAVRRPDLRGRGVEAVALAEALGGRQNLPSLGLADHIADAERLAGAAAVRDARARIAALDPPARVALGLAVLGGSDA